MKPHHLRSFAKDKHLYTMSAIGVALALVFHYAPMYGTLIAFKEYSVFQGFMKSPWIGMEHFREFFTDSQAIRAIKNTFLLNLYNLLFGFPAPIVLALLLNEMKNGPFKRLTQTISYLPHFISIVIVIGMLKSFFSTDGIINALLGTHINFFSNSEWFRPLFVGSGIWQGIGWGTIIYLAAISGINPELYESSSLEGASRLQNMIRITLPSISNVIMILLILEIGKMLNVGFEKVYLMYSPAIYETADVLATYIYRIGIENGRIGYGAAVGLFNNIINLILLLAANFIVRRVNSDNSLW